MRSWSQGTDILVLAAMIAAILPGSAHAQDRTVLFETEGAGEVKASPDWGLDTAWLSEDNVRRSAVFMGKPQVALICFSFAGDWVLQNGKLGSDAQAEFDARMAIVNNYADAHVRLYLNNDTADWNTNPFLVMAHQDGVDAAKNGPS